MRDFLKPELNLRIELFLNNVISQKSTLSLFKRIREGPTEVLAKLKLTFS